MEGHARLQSNIIVRKLSGFSSKFDKFSDTIVPLFWMEYVSLLYPISAHIYGCLLRSRVIIHNRIDCSVF